MYDFLLALLEVSILLDAGEQIQLIAGNSSIFLGWWHTRHIKALPS
jgi:hypothetical protein